MRWPALLLALAAGSVAQAQPAPPPQRGAANPSAVIAAEIAFAQLAQDKGQWTAFAEYAAPDAVMFVPQMVLARDWLKGRANPPVAVRWQPHRVWSSCDGSLAVSTGAWQRPGGTGWFTTIWQRQKNGGYKWVLDHGDALREPLVAPEMIAALVAGCPRRERGAARTTRPEQPRQARREAAPFDPAKRTGRSDDGTLTWEVVVDPSGARNLSVAWTKDGRIQPATIEEVAAPPTGAR
jgi:hypothetical protein